MQQTILIHSTKITPRLQYAFKILLTTLHKFELRFTEQESIFQETQTPKISYKKIQSVTQSPTLQLIATTDVMFEDTLNRHSFDAVFSDVAAPTFDIIAAAFCVLTRYEEYVVAADAFDVHGRFKSAHSRQKKNEWLYIPIVQIWSNALIQLLQDLFPEVKPFKHPYQFIPTYDIDRAWMYKHRGWVLQAGGFLKDLFSGNIKEVKQRTEVLLGLQPDPDFTFTFLETLHTKYHLRPIFFWLLGAYSKFDKNISPKIKTKCSSCKKYFLKICAVFILHTHRLQILKN